MSLVGSKGKNKKKRSRPAKGEKKGSIRIILADCAHTRERTFDGRGLTMEGILWNNSSPSL